MNNWNVSGEYLVKNAAAAAALRPINQLIL